MIRASLSLGLLLMLQGGMGPGPGTPASSGGPTMTFVQACGLQTAGSVTTASCTGATIAAHHLLYACVDNANNTPGTVTFTGDTGTQTPDIAVTGWVGTGGYVKCVYILNSVGGNNYIQANGSGLFYPGVTWEEWNCSPTCTLDQSDAGATGTSTSAVSNSITTTANGDLVIGHIIEAAGSALSVGAGYTLSASTAYPSLNEHLIQVSAGAITGTGTLAASNPWFAHVIAFK